jgi:tRNA U34 5-methylaminomethyl-2-thiouridine-forming methyltransferase MnmC
MNNKNTIKVERTADGSSTLMVKEMDEHYHSVKGALTESEHVFRDCAFLYRHSMHTGTGLNPESDDTQCTPVLRLLEIGFGTGLNAIVTAMAAKESARVHYMSIEKYPLDINLIDSLDYNKIIDGNILKKIHSAEWNRKTEITPWFSLEKLHSDYLECKLPQDIDIIYFDAFAPEKQPEMWSEHAFARLYQAMKHGGVMTTYCSKGCIRRLLESIGFTVERIPGPPGGKREILRATKI